MNKSLLLMFCVFSLVNPLHSVAQSFNVVNDLKNNYLSTKNKISKSEVFTRRVSKTLYKVNRQMRRLRYQRNKLSTQLQETQFKVSDLNEKIGELEKNISDRKSQIAKQMKALYKLSRFNKFMYILSSSSLHEFEQNMKYIKLYSEADYNLILSYSSDIEELKNAKIDLDKNLQKLNRVSQKLVKRNKSLDKKMKSKKVLLTHLKKQRKKYFSKLSQIKNLKDKLKLSNKIENLNEIFGTNFFEKRGALFPPVSGIKIEKFGVSLDKKYKNKIKNNGLFFRSQQNAKVKNIHKGKVSFIGKLRGLGLVVIVDHSDHYYSLYANNSTVKVRKGDTLEAGQVIGDSGFSPYHNTYGTYFEIRHFSEPLDPENWLIKSGSPKS